MQHILKPYNSRAILNNLELVFKTSNIEKLNKPAYQFVANMSNFIAHYDLYGFQNHYENVDTLIEEIIASVDSYLPDHGYYTESYGQPYADSVRDIYRGLGSLCPKYLTQNKRSSADKATQKLEETYSLMGETLRRNDPDLSRAMLDKLEISYA